MEIERKFTVRKLPDNLDSYPFHIIAVGFLEKMVIGILVERKVVLFSCHHAFAFVGQVKSIVLAADAYHRIGV